MKRFYFTVSSELYGSEEFGPYDTALQAQYGMDRVQMKAEEHNDDVQRTYDGPYSRED